jgi:hypothetical protein
MLQLLCDVIGTVGKRNSCTSCANVRILDGSYECVRPTEEFGLANLLGFEVI